MVIECPGVTFSVLCSAAEVSYFESAPDFEDILETIKVVGKR